jgi:hypothetical protein
MLERGRGSTCCDCCPQHRPAGTQSYRVPRARSLTSFGWSVIKLVPNADPRSSCFSFSFITTKLHDTPRVSTAVANNARAASIANFQWSAAGVEPAFILSPLRYLAAHVSARHHKSENRSQCRPSRLHRKRFHLHQIARHNGVCSRLLTFTLFQHVVR